MADLLVIKANGSIRTSNWTFHNGAISELAGARLNQSDPKRYHSILSAIRDTSERHKQNRSLHLVGLSPVGWNTLFQALVEAESAYNPTAISPKGAYGLGQLMPDTAKSLGVDRSVPSENLEGAARYFLAQLSEFRDIDLALAAYNAGPHRVREYSGVPPFNETRNYIARIHRIRERLSGRGMTRAPAFVHLN